VTNEKKTKKWWWKGVGVDYGEEEPTTKYIEHLFRLRWSCFHLFFCNLLIKIVGFFIYCIFLIKSWNFIFENDWKLVSLTATLKQLFNSIYYLMVQCVFAVPRYNYYVKMNGRFVFTSISRFALCDLSIFTWNRNLNLCFETLSLVFNVF